MHIKIRNVRILQSTFALSMAVVIGLAVANWKLVDDAEQSSRLVEHTHDVIAIINELRFDTIQIEYAVQSFRITGDPERMDDRRRISGSREKAFTALMGLIADNPSQLERSNNLRRVINERIGYADKIQQLRQSQGDQAATDYVKTVPLAASRNYIYKTLSDLEAEENRLLALRLNKFHRYREHMLLVGLLSVTLLGIATLSVFFLTRNQLERDKLKQAELEHLMLTDPLTGVGNRRMIMAQLTREIVRAQRYSASFTVVYIDIDHFKRINDQFGHRIGDEVLVEVARCIASNLRQSDCFARFGGEEFLVLLTETSLTNAQVIAEKLRLAVTSLQIASIDSSVTISAGLAERQGGESAETLLSRADSALYRAKKSGRNCICTDSFAGVPA